MNNLHILSTSDLTDDETFKIFSKILDKNKNTLFICANKSTKDLLQQNLKEHNTNNKYLKLYCDVEFSSTLSNNVFKNRRYLSNMDCKYILLKQIEIQFKSNPDKIRILHDIYHKLYDLYSFMMFNNIEINDEIIKKISLDFPNLEVDIFNLYRGYNDLITNVVNSIKKGENHILTNFIKPLDSPDEEFDTYQNHIKNELNIFTSENDVVILNGFLFFDDYYKYLIKTLINKEKELYLMLKQSKCKEINDHVFNDHYFKIFNSNNNHEFKKSNKTIESNSALDYLKEVFPSNNKINKKLSNDDNSIKIVKPFPDRDSELRYVINDISNYLKQHGNNDLNIIKRILDDVAIIISVKKNQYEDRISSILQDIGLFVYKNNEEEIKCCFNKEIDFKNIKNIYYNKNEFLNENIKYTDNTSLTYEEKHTLFKLAFKGLEINKTERPIASYPIGQFIIQIYNILLNGITPDCFKILLYSNWEYHTKLSKQKWDKYISEFELIKTYFESKTAIQEWIDTLKNLISIKEEIKDNNLFTLHPLYAIEKESLIFFHDITVYLKSITEEIGTISGNLQQHIKLLKDKLLKVDDIINIKEDNMSFEQKIIKKLYDTLEKININSVINNVDAHYFAENIKHILSNYDNPIESEASDLKLNVIKLVNSKKYSRVYFVMLEFDKYPRIYGKEKFPYTKDIINILNNEKYDICCIPSDYYSLDYHLNVETYLFMNVLDFTKDEMIITMSDNEYGTKNLPSIFLKDIINIFDGQVKILDYNIVTKDNFFLFEDDNKKFKLNKKNKYKLVDLSKFKLCPKLYLHNRISDSIPYVNRFQLKFYFGAVLFCDTLKKFKDYNLKNEMVYNVNDDKSNKIILNLFNESWDFCSKAFSCLSKFEQNDIKINTRNKIEQFIPNIIKHSVKGKWYTIIENQNESFKGNGYELILTYNTLVYSNETKQKRISQEDLFIDFLVLKTGEDKDIVHYSDMIKTLDENPKNCDRVNLIYKIIGKINRQFASRTYAYSGSDCGIDRTNKIVNEINNYDFNNAKPMVSKYCMYCGLNNICMAQCEELKENGHEKIDR